VRDDDWRKVVPLRVGAWCAHAVIRWSAASTSAGAAPGPISAAFPLSSDHPLPAQSPPEPVPEACTPPRSE